MKTNAPGRFECEVYLKAWQLEMRGPDVLDHIDDRDWRRAHKGLDESPEDHLWRAARAVADLLDALDAAEAQPDAG